MGRKCNLFHPIWLLFITVPPLLKVDGRLEASGIKCDLTLKNSECWLFSSLVKSSEGT